MPEDKCRECEILKDTLLHYEELVRVYQEDKQLYKQLIESLIERSELLEKINANLHKRKA